MSHALKLDLIRATVVLFSVLAHAETVPVLVFGGQSLAICSGTDTGLLPTNSPLLAPQPNVLFFNARTHTAPTGAVHWVTYQAPTGQGYLDCGHTNSLGSFGPEATAAELISQSFGSRVAVYKYAVGAAAMHNHWLPGRDYYRDMTNKLALALAQLQSECGVTGRVVGLFWTQGESDALDGVNYASDYGSNLVNFVSAWRANLGYRVPFVFAQILPQWPNSALVRVGQRQLTNWIADVQMVDMDDCPTPTKHWDNEGTIKAGQRYAAAFRNIIFSRNSLDIAGDSDGIRLSIYGPPARRCTVLWTADFVSWERLSDAETDLAGIATVTEKPIASRFYRASWE